MPPLRLAQIMVAAIDESAADKPNTFKQAMKLPDAKSWREAMVAEVNSLIENKVYEVVDRPAYKRVVSSKWLFKKKRGISGAVEKYKARLVAKGFTQEEGVDYFETFAPTVRCESVRLMLAEAATKKLHTAQMDVTTAFVRVKLSERWNGENNHYRKRELHEFHRASCK